MKIRSLEFENIGSFRKKEFIDFTVEPLCSAPIIAVTGRTASGKTTLMIDAMCVALYNKTPRLDKDKVKNKNRGHFLNKSAHQGFVNFIFEINGKVYRAKWEAKRNKDGGVTSKSTIIDIEKNKLVNVADIFGMDFEAFRRSVLLAQGEFSAFLYADMEEKRKIIESVANMEIYERLKEILNEKVRIATLRYNDIKDSIKTIPLISPEDINVENKKLYLISEELKKFNELKISLDKEKIMEQERNNIYRELEENNNIYKELLLKKDYIDNIRKKIDSAENAMNISSTVNLYISLKQNYENLSDKLEDVRKEFEDEQNNFNSIKSAYEKVRKILEDAKDDASKKRILFDEAADYETKGNGLLEEAENKRKEAIELKNGIDMLEIDIKDKNSEIEKLRIGSLSDNVYIEEHPISDNINESILDASEKTTLIKINEDVLIGEKNKLEKKKLDHNRCNKGFKTLFSDNNDYEDKKKRCYNALDDINKSILKITNEGDKNYWTSMRNLWNDVKDSRHRFIQLYDRFSNVFCDKEICKHSQQMFKDTINDYKDKIENVNLEIVDAEEKLKLCKQRREFEYARHQAIVLRKKHLKNGIECLVCGSIEHPWAEKVDVDIEKTIKSVDKDIQVTKSNIESAKRKLEDMFDKLFEISNMRAEECQRNISEIERLLGEKHDLEIELNIINEIIDIVDKIIIIEIKISEDKKEFFDIIPCECRNKDINISLKNFKNLISSIKECKNRVKDREYKINIFNNSINENDKRMRSDIIEHNKFLQSIKENYEDKAKDCLKIALEITNGLGAKKAKDELEEQLSMFEKLEKECGDKFQESRNRLSEIGQTLNNLNSDIDIASKEYEKANYEYSKALEVAGFKCIEDYNISIRDNLWLEENRKVIFDHDRNVCDIKKSIESQEKNFSEKPYNVNDLEEIIEKERVLRSDIEDRIREKGEIGQIIKNIEENIVKREKQLNLLDERKKEMDRWKNLQNIIPANDFRDFALEIMFGIIVSFANDQLSRIESRYSLKVSGIDNMVITDEWNAGESRPVNTLSGGESFIVSLSLALALSEISMGRSTIQSLFIDEGFGTLDPETLEKVLYALEMLRLSGKTIYVISHVSQLTRHIPTKISVKTINGSSRVV